MTQLYNMSDTEVSIDQGKSGSHNHHHDHRHKVKLSGGPHNDYGMAGVLLHIAGDAVNNVGVIIAGLIIWKTDHPGRFYADPAVSLFIALMILISAIPLGESKRELNPWLGNCQSTNENPAVKKTGHILLQSPPTGIDVDDIKHDLEKVCALSSTPLPSLYPPVSILCKHELR
jgi:zinc transporter 1